MKTWTLRNVVLLAGVALIALSGCAGIVSRNHHATDPRFVAMVADLEPAMERVSSFGGHRSPPIPQIMVSDELELDVLAGFSSTRNVIVVNRRLLEAPQRIQRVVLAHELGHWARWKGSLCHKDWLACEIGANAASVPILEVGWGISYAAAVEQVYSMLALSSLSPPRVDPEGAHDALAELAAFRKHFGCADPTNATCAGPPRGKLLEPKKPEVAR